MSPPEERLLWSDRPSQVLSLRIYLINCIVLILLLAGATQLGLSQLHFFVLALVLVAAPTAWMLSTWVKINARCYEITTERLRLWSGVFNRQLVEIELYRARETVLYLPLSTRLFNAGTIEVAYSDATGVGFVRMVAVPDPVNVRELLRQAIEGCRSLKAVRAVERG